MHDVVKVLLLTWQANDLGLKAPVEKGSLVLDETLDLEGVFRDDYGYSTQNFQIPSRCSEISLQNVLVQIALRLELDAEMNKKRPLLIVYYNGHAFRSAETHDFMFAA